MTPPRAWLLPAPPETPNTGTWKAENNGSAEMVGAAEYAPVSELDRSKRLRDQYREALDAERNHSNPARQVRHD